MTLARLRCTLLAAALPIGLTGCSVTTAGGERLRPRDPAFADYVETVFRQQNEAATALAFALDETDFDSARYRTLEATETALLDACSELNAMATARQRANGDGPGGLSALRAARTAPDCERAAVAAAEVID